MTGYTKQYIEATVLSYDGRVYTFLFPNQETVVLRHATVHERCEFPKHLMEDGHLKTGASIHMCIIDRDGQRSVLPDHRFYLYSKFSERPDGTIERKNDTAALRSAAKVIRQCARMFEDGCVEPALLILKSFISSLENENQITKQL